MKILEALARITAKSQVSLYQQMDKFRTIFPMGATLVVVTHTTTPALRNLARQLKQDGRSLLCVSIEQATEQEKPAVVSINGEAY
jgi:hypothetical protein